MVEEIRKYRTSDGMLFDSKDEAEKYDGVLKRLIEIVMTGSYSREEKAVLVLIECGNFLSDHSETFYETADYIDSGKRCAFINLCWRILNDYSDKYEGLFKMYCSANEGSCEPFNLDGEK